MIANSGPTPLGIDRRLRQRVTEAVIAQAGIRHSELNAFLRARLAGDDVMRGALFAEPSIEGAASYVSSATTPQEMSGNLLHPRLVEALTGKPGDDYRFNYPAYAHQIEAWRHLLAADSRSVLVSSGTGSGKTECFLIPLLNDLAREASLTGRLRGVRALMLYPLNALIASQEERLRRWIAPFGGQIRFALYNGLMADKRKSDREKAEKEYPEQVLYRATLRSDPPPVLVTNNTMLEYMTIRREDHPLLEASQGLLRWVVIDEAHSYVGSAAAEVSLLLRRVLQAFGVSAKQVRFVATSATLGGTDDKAKADLQRYLADLAGVPLSQVHVVFGARHKVALPPPTSAGRLTLEQLEPGGGFEKNPAVQELVRAAEKGAVSMARAGQIAAGAGLDPVPLVEAIGAAALLPLRVHKFIRAIPGLWSCLNPDCDGERPEAWPFGALHFERSETCKICTAPVFELISCRECGEPFLNGYDHGDHLSPQAIAPDRDEFAVASARELDEPDDGEQDDDDTEAIKSVLRRDGDRRLIGTRLTDGLFERDVDPTRGALPEKRGEGRVLHLSRPVLDASCPCCRAAPSRRSGTVLWPFRFGAPFLIQNAAPTMLEGVKPSDRVNIELPAQGRQLLSFTDSRQGTARFAANIETMSERSYVRTFVYHLAQKAAAPQPLTREERTDLEAKRAKFAALVESDATFKPYLTEIEQQLSGRSANATVPWNDAVRDFSSEPMLKQWIGKVWDADRDDRFHRDPKALANYLILRELARRPRRANAIETLGLGKLVFPQIEKLTESRLPGPIKRQGYSLSVWRDFLYFLVDSVIRTNFVLNVSREDARWLLPRNAFLRGIVGPDQDRRIPSDVTWPKARAGGGIKTNAVLLLEKHLNLDSDSGEDRATINDILTQAWDQMRPLLEGSGSTFALGLDMAGIAAVDEAWLCPVTHRVLPRLVFGRTPYSVRHVSTGALQPVEAVRFPALPYFFPINDRERAALAEFVQSDPMIAALRRRGVWGNLHDRAATFAPYIRAEEHSAQQPPYRLREFEAQFKQGEINLLACSTTMEMGVDIGSVEAVLNTNVPPSIANYRQRVGRAGRRGQHFASSLTFARDTPLDRETFVDPIKYLGRELRSPQVKLDSRRIVQRHVNALLLAQWFRQAKGELMRVRAGQFFGCPEGVILAPDETPPVELFRNWLITPSTATVLSDRLTALTVGTAFQDNGSVLQIAADMFHQAANAYRDQWDSLRQQAGAVVTEAKASLEMQIRRFCREPLLKELSTRSLLPGHGFPNAIVPFVNDCAETLNRQRLRSDEESETVRNRRYDYPSRNADVAIREYAPGAEVVVDGLVWTSAGVTLNWLRPAHDAGAREIQSIRWSWQCNDCGEADCSFTMPEHCVACGSATLQCEQFLEPAGFRVDWRCKPHGETDRVDYIEPQPVRISARDARWEPLLDPALGRCRSTGDGLVFHHSMGSHKAGYRVCLDCGRAEDASGAGLTDHDALTPLKGGAGRCRGNDKTFAITRPLALGHEILTDVAELQPTGLDSPGAAWAFVSALREALSRRLGIEPRELGLGVSERNDALGGQTHSVFLFDQSAGGAGYAPRLFDDLLGILKEAQAILNCPAQCASGCSACVLVADLFAQQDIIDRVAALSFVNGMLSGMGEPAPEDMAGQGCCLSRPVADAIARRLKVNDIVSIWVADDFDFAALSGPPLSTLLSAVGAVGAKLRLVVAPALFEALDYTARAGLRNASHRYNFAIFLGHPFIAGNGARLLATLTGTAAAAGFLSRDADSALLGPGWGVGSKHPVVEIPMAELPAVEPVKEGALERISKPGDRVRILAGDPGRPAKLFGSGFVNRILKQELEAADLWKPGHLIELTYSDRYLKAPLPVLLMLRAAASIKDALAAEGVTVSLSISTETLKNDRYDGHPSRLAHNWRSEDDRKETVVHLAALLGLDCRYNSAIAPHGRKLTIRYDDQTEAVVLFDQGFGYWRAGTADRHDFGAKAIQQAKSLCGSSAFVVGHGESYLAITRKPSLS